MFGQLSCLSLSIVNKCTTPHGNNRQVCCSTRTLPDIANSQTVQTWHAQELRNRDWNESVAEHRLASTNVLNVLTCCLSNLSLRKKTKKHLPRLEAGSFWRCGCGFNFKTLSCKASEILSQETLSLHEDFIYSASSGAGPSRSLAHSRP